MEQRMQRVQRMQRMQRAYFVKVENIQVPDQLRATKLIEATTISELKEKIYEYYEIHDNHRKNIQLWSASFGMQNRMRIDILDEIPENVEHIYIVGQKTD